MRYVVALVLIAFLCGTAQITVAQDKTAAELLPTPNRLGPGWIKERTFPAPPDLSDAYADAAYAVYAGPRGARAVLSVYVVAEGMTAIRDSWEIANERFEGYRGEFDYDYDSGREDTLAEEPLPDGCADARRTYGVETIGFEIFAVGLTLCAADPDVIVLAYSSRPSSQGGGYQASDGVVSAVLQLLESGSGSNATPGSA